MEEKNQGIDTENNFLKNIYQSDYLLNSIIKSTTVQYVLS